MQTHDVDVLVVGAGPMGATTALALAKYGVKVRMVNRYNWTANTPRAHITNQRAVEVLRDLGVEPDARREATPWEWMGDTLFTTSFAGPEIARIRTWGTGEKRIGDYLQGSPCTMLDLPQNKMEPLLVKHAATSGAELSFNTEYISHDQDETGVTVTLREVGTGRVYQTRARYLVGADGAKSKVMDDAGLVVEGQLARAATAYVLFRADLTKYVAHRPSILYWIVTSNAAFGEIGMGLLRAIEPWKQWIAGWGFDMKNGEPDFSPEEVLRKVRILVGDPDLEIEIDSTSVWYVNQAHAPVYSKGRVFCGGDAVHRHPPSSGLGSNTCMQDAFNLAWKLAYVVKGFAGERLLDSYSLERAPVGAQIVARANQSRLDYAPLNQCFRDPKAADPVKSGLEKLAEPGPEGVARRSALAAALETKNTEFNAQGVEMNQRCVSAAVVPDPNAEEEVFIKDRQLYLQATTRPGAKLPHAWLIDAAGSRVSTLDLVGKGKFTLVTGIDGRSWVDAVKEISVSYLDLLVVGEIGAQDIYCNWHAIREIDEAGALLVRPDGVIAWRNKSGVADSKVAKRELAHALAAVLSNEQASQ
ncbi:FAD-dependent monooxygenase [Polaromonas sp.]|uniref:FAD-dependent monooxygenase n=1 Tax=Polaromonas sp. TaxID=1869339 RepID=UPI003BAD63D6